MAIDPSPLLAWPLLGGFIALPALAAWRRRRESREASAVAGDLAAYAVAVRGAGRCLPMEDALVARIARLRLADAAALRMAQELERGGAAALAGAAQRLATRLRRRVAFQRKMLARTAPGLRRGAIAASVPPLLLLALQWLGTEIPVVAQFSLFAAEAAGCALLCRLARVEI